MFSYYFCFFLHRTHVIINICIDSNMAFKIMESTKEIEQGRLFIEQESLDKDVAKRSSARRYGQAKHSYLLLQKIKSLYVLFLGGSPDLFRYVVPVRCFG